MAGREAGFGLASQEPWIQHASVRDNILFGRDYDPGFYQAVIQACALSDDLNVPCPASVFPSTFTSGSIIFRVFPSLLLKQAEVELKFCPGPSLQV